MPSPKALVHVGTSKTGTSSIQSYFSHHSDALRKAGLHATPGQHELAFDLMHARRDSLEALVRELRDNSSPNVFISSEEFHPLAAGNGLSILHDILSGAGYETTAIVYVRDQAEYAQSMYAETAKGPNGRRFSAYLNDIARFGVLSNGPAYQIFFEYSKLVRALGHIFGDTHVVVRPYQAKLVGDILRVIASVDPALELPAHVDPSPSLNGRASLIAVLADIYEGAARAASDAPNVATLLQRSGTDPNDERLQQPFSPMSRSETLFFVHRFAQDNTRVEGICSIVIPATREEEIAAESDPRWSDAAWQRRVLDITTDVWLR